MLRIEIRKKIKEKRGMAYGYHSVADMEAISGSVSWWYNWSHKPESTVANVFQNYEMDFVPMTWNGSFNETGLSSDIARYKKYNRPIWLTEFACWDQPSIKLDMQKGYMMGAIDYLESDTSVFRYAWFNGNRSGAYPYLDLLKPQSGQLTDLGKLYLSFNPVHDTSSYAVIPAKLEAENYTTMSGINIEATKDISGVANVGWIDAKDWLEYYIDVPIESDYNVFFRIAASSATNLTIRENGLTLKTLQIPSSGGYQNWKTLKTNVTLTAGKHKLQIYTNIGQFNLNWLEITTSSQPTLVRNTVLSNTRVYPNPVIDRLIVESDELSSETQISIFDLAGRIIFAKTWAEKNSKIEIDFSNFQSGSYIVQVKNDGKISNHLIVK